MPDLDPITLKEIAGRLKSGDVDGATAEMERLAPRYPGDDELQKALELLGEGKHREASAALEAAASARVMRSKGSHGLPLRDFREKEDRGLEGR